MNSAKKLLSALSVFALAVLMVSAVSALSFNSPSNDLSLSKNTSTITIVNNDGIDQTVTLNSPVFSDGTNSFILSVSDSSFVLPASGQKTITLTASNVPAELKIGRFTSNLIASSNESSVANATSELEFVSSFCSSGFTDTNLSIKDIAISNLGEGADDEWKLLDTIEVEIEVKNNGDDRVDDVFVELALIDGSGEDVTSNLDFENKDDEKIDLGNIGDGDTKTATFRFEVSSDIEDSSNYKLVVKAYSDDLGEEFECADNSGDLSDDFFELIKVESETDVEKFLKVTNVILRPADLTCGDVVDLSFDVVNIGDDDVEDQFRVNVINSALGINLFKDIKKDLNRGDKEKISLSFNIPSSAKDGTYALGVYTESDYDDSSDTYDTRSDGTETVNLVLKGCTPSTQTDSVLISASVDSEVSAGNEFTVSAEITNMMSEPASFVVSPTGFEDWAEFVSASSRMFSLDSGDSKEITFIFKAKEGVSGENTLEISALSGGNEKVKTVSVDVQGSSSQSIGTLLSGNTLLWVIGAINLILIILIIAVAVRVSRR